MKKIFAVSLYLIICTNVFSQPKKIDVVRYQFEIGLNDQSDTLQGRATIWIKFIQSGNSLSIDLAQSQNGKKGMLVQSVTGPAVASFDKGTDKIQITFKNTFNRDDSTYCVVTYSGIPADGLIISKNKFGHRSFFSDNWPNRAHQWIPCVDDPADKAPVEFIVTAPVHYQVVSNGIKVEESNLPDNKKMTRWQEDVPLPTKVMVIGVADFAVNFSGETNCVPVYSWVFPENKANGFSDYAPAKDILTFYMNYIGPYPYKKLANVQSKTIFGGMENASAIFYFENSVTGRKDQEELLSHEIVHQWFGNMATESNFAHLWLSEGFATYLTHIFMEKKYGADSLQHEMQKDRNAIIAFAHTSTRPVVDSLSPLMQLLNANSYQKGGWALHMLRRQLGDSVFHQVIRTYYDTYKGKNAVTEDLQGIAEKVGGKKLDFFFHQWLYTPGVPELFITWKYNEKTKIVSVTVDQQQKTFPFQIPLDIELTDVQGKKTIEKLQLSRKTETFNLPAKAKVTNLLADPQTWLLFEGSVNATN